MPRVVVLGGVNGAGKTTSADRLLNVMKIPIFTNADAIARGLKSLDPESQAFRSGRVMLKWMNDLVDEGKDFALETTLAARSYIAWLRKLKERGYKVYLFYTWLASAEVAVARVQQRVRSGGHNIPEEDILRRYGRSVKNFLEEYMPLADEWELYDNTIGERRLIAMGDTSGQVFESENDWKRVLRSAKS